MLTWLWMENQGFLWGCDEELEKEFTMILYLVKWDDIVFIQNST